MPLNDLLTITEQDAEQVLRKAYADDPERDCCERSFVSLTLEPYMLHPSLQFMGLTVDKGVIKKDIYFKWETQQQAITTAMENKAEIKRQARRLRNAVSTLADEFAGDYDAGEDLSRYPAAIEQVKEEWFAFLGTLFTRGGFSVLPVLVNRVETSAMSVLSSIQSAAEGSYFNSRSFVEDRQKMMAQNI